MFSLSTAPFALLLFYLGWKDAETHDLPESVVGLLWAYMVLVLAFLPPTVSFWMIALLVFVWFVRIVSVEIEKFSKSKFIHKKGNKLLKSLGEIGMGDVFVAPPFILFSTLEFGLFGTIMICIATLIGAEGWHQYNLRMLKKKTSNIPLVYVATLFFLAAVIIKIMVVR